LDILKLLIPPCINVTGRRPTDEIRRHYSSHC